MKKAVEELKRRGDISVQTFADYCNYFINMFIEGPMFLAIFERPFG
ncbi:MAG: hypothetical protein ACLFQE_08230 [Thermotogota bacterium]